MHGLKEGQTLEKRRPKDKEICPSGRLWSRVKENFKVSSTVRRIVHYPVLFLIGYYTIQICYQLDILCSTPELKNVEACRKRCSAYFKQWNENSSLFLKLFTFLIGFYVSNIVSRWWVKFRLIPEAENPLLVLSGLVVPNRGTDSSSSMALNSQWAVMEVKKMGQFFSLWY